MDALVENVNSVMAVLDSHNARHLVNENVVFERLETESLTSSLNGEELVNRVVHNILVEFGIAPPDDPDSPLSIIEAGPTSCRINQADSPEVCVLSPATAQAFNEPYSPLPHCLDIVSNVDEGEGLKNTTDVPVDNKLAAVPKSCQSSLPDVKCSNKTEPASINGESNASSSRTWKNTGAIPKTSSIPKASSVSTGAVPKQRKAKDNSMNDVLNTAIIINDPMNVEPQLVVIKTEKIETTKLSPSKNTEDYNRSPGKRSSDEPTNESKRRKASPSSGSTASSSGTKSYGRVSAHVATLSDMFPEADPDYLWNRCEQVSDDESFNALIVQMLSDSDYPRVHGLRVNHNAPSAAGSSKDLPPVPVSKENGMCPRGVFTVSQNHNSPVYNSATKVSSSKSVASNSTSVATMTTAVASTSKVVKSEPSTISKSNSETAVNKEATPVTVVKSEPSTSTSKANFETVGKKHTTQVSSLSEVKHRLSLKNEAAAISKEPWEDQLDTFLQIFPDADPSFLEEKARLLTGKENELRMFVADALERKDYPSRKDWQWRQDQLALQKKYTEEFSIPNFLEIIPDPFTHFPQQKRNLSLHTNQATMFLRNKYRKLRVADISSTFVRNNYNLTLTCRELDNWAGPLLKGKRSQVDYDVTMHDGGKGINVPFLQEIAFIENEKKIVQYLEDKKSRKEAAFKEAKEKGELLECQCCFDDEVMFEDVRPCSEGHIFCVSCLQRSSETRIGDGHTTFPCLANCSAEFNLQTLQEILKPTVFSRLVQRKQAEEVKAAGIEDLVQCPFCDFCNIPPKEDKVFRCLNPDCMKESCRLCKEESHVPLRCDEVEKKSDVEMRTYIENQMTEALVRTCWKCAKKFVKSDGCNKMTCQCGAKMCYICRQPVTDYSHFNGQGGDEHHKCPLYSDHHALEVAEVKRVAEQAKLEVLAKIPSGSLKHDPTKILPVHQPPPPGHYDDFDFDSEEEQGEEEDDYGVDDFIFARHNNFMYQYMNQYRHDYDYYNDVDEGEEEEEEEEEEEVDEEEEEEDRNNDYFEHGVGNGNADEQEDLEDNENSDDDTGSSNADEQEELEDIENFDDDTGSSNADEQEELEDIENFDDYTGSSNADEQEESEEDGNNEGRDSTDQSEEQSSQCSSAYSLRSPGGDLSDSQSDDQNSSCSLTYSSYSSDFY